MFENAVVIAIFKKESKRMVLKIDYVKALDHFWLETEDENGSLIEKSEVVIEWSECKKLLERYKVIYLEKEYMNPEFYQLFYDTFYQINYSSFSPQQRILYLLRLFYNKTKIKKKRILEKFSMSDMQFTRDLRELRKFLAEEGKGIKYNRLDDVYKLI